MKQKMNILGIIIVMILAQIFVSCSGKKESTTTVIPSQNTPAMTQSSSNTIDTSTVAGFLTQFGLIETDLKPEGAGDGVMVDISSSRNRATITWNMENASADQENDWLKKVYDKTKALSTDGKVYVDGTDLTEEYIFVPLNRAAYESDVNWVYSYNGKEVGVRCQLLGGGAVDLRLIII